MSQNPNYVLFARSFPSEIEQWKQYLVTTKFGRFSVVEKIAVDGTLYVWIKELK